MSEKNERNEMKNNNFNFSIGRPLTHEEAEALLAAYTADELEPAEQSAFEQHLAQCEQCQHTFAEVQHIRKLLTTLASAPPSPVVAASNSAGDDTFTSSLLADAVIAKLTGHETVSPLPIIPSRPLFGAISVLDADTEIVSLPSDRWTDDPQKKMHQERRNNMKSHGSRALKWRTLQQRLGIIAAVVILTLLVSSMLVVLNLVHQSQSGSLAAYDPGIYVNDINGIYKLDAKTRAVIWHKAFGTASVGEEDVSGMFPTSIVGGGSLVVYDGAIYVSAFEGSYPTIPYVYAISTKDGSVLWRDQLESKVVTIKIPPVVIPPGVTHQHITLGGYTERFDLGYITQPMVVDGKVIVLSRTGKVSAFDAKNGAKLWVYENVHLSALVCTTSNSYQSCYIGSSSSLIGDHNLVYVGMLDRLYAIDVTHGTQQWTTHLLANQAINDLVVENNSIYATSTSSLNPGLSPPTDSYAYALKASDGSQLWATNKIAGPLTGPAVGNGIVSFGSVDGTLYALHESDGLQIWQKNIDGLIGSPPIIVNGIIYAQAGKGGVVNSQTRKIITKSSTHTVALNTSDGSMRWQFSHDVSLQAVSNGVVYTFLEPTWVVAGNHPGNNVIYAYKASDGSELWHDVYKTSSAQTFAVIVVP